MTDLERIYNEGYADGVRGNMSTYDLISKLRARLSDELLAVQSEQNNLVIATAALDVIHLYFHPFLYDERLTKETDR